MIDSYEYLSIHTVGGIVYVLKDRQQLIQVIIVFKYLVMSFYENKRQQIMKNIRKQQLEKYFQQVRNQRNPPLIKEEFLSIYPYIDEDNYPQHKNFLKRYSYDEEFALLQTALVGYVYDFLMENANDVDSIEILKAITVFEEVDVPQTDQFLDWLIYLTKISPFDSLVIASNLLNHKKYQSLLRDMLLQREYIYHLPIEQFKEENRIVELTLLAEIECSIISSHPVVEPQIYFQACKRINQLILNENIKWLIGNTFIDIRTTFKSDKRYAQILMQTFKDFIICQFSSLTFSCLNLLFYCGNSGFFLRSSQLQTLIILSFENKTHETECIIELAISVLNMMIQNKIQLDLDELSNKLLNIFVKGENSTKKIVLPFFNKHFLSNLDDEIPEETVENILDLIEVDSNFTIEGLKFILALLETEKEKYVYWLKQSQVEKALQIIRNRKVTEEIEYVDMIEKLLQI